MKCSKTSWYTAVLTLDLRKHSGPTPADDMATQTITDCGNFTLDLKQRGFCASPLFLQTLGPWFPKEMQNLLSSENITLDHSAAVQSFLSLAQARRFWRCQFKSGLTQGMRQPKPMSCISLCVVVLEALTPAAVHSLWISPTFLNGFCFTILSRVRLSLLLVHFFLMELVKSTFWWYSNYMTSTCIYMPPWMPTAIKYKKKKQTVTIMFGLVPVMSVISSN